MCATAAAALMLQPLGAYAAATTIAPTLAEIPIQGLNPAKPNVMFTLDDSGSMDFEFLPDYTAFVDTGVYHCRDGFGPKPPATGKSCGGGTAQPGSGYVFSQYDPPVRSSAYNGIYYDPKVVYNAGVKVDGTLLPCESTDTTCGSPWTLVYDNGFAFYSAAGLQATNSGTKINLAAAWTTATGSAPAGYPDTVWCWRSPSSSDKLTAIPPALGGTGTGNVCRLNGIPYPAGVTPLPLPTFTTPSVAAGYNYPNAIDPATGAATPACAAGTKCLFTFPAKITGNPYYYTVSKVEFCPAQNAAGWGTGACTDLLVPKTNQYVRYGGGAFNPQAFTRVDIRPSTNTFVVNGLDVGTTLNVGGGFGVVTVPVAMANFSKWYAFNRTRLLAMKTAGGLAFSSYVDSNQMNAGFHSLHEAANAVIGGFLNIKNFDNAQATQWFTNFYTANANGGTPLPDAVWRIGQYFSNAMPVTGLPSSGANKAVDPLASGTGKCENNYHLLSTDGYWNAPLATAAASTLTPKDQDRTVPSLAYLPGQTGFTPGAQFPGGYWEGPTATDSYLADLAMKYWINDIRPTIPNDKIKDAIAPWQHVVLYGLAIGARGSIRYTGNQATDLAAIIAGTKNWTVANPNPIDGTNQSDPAAIDDLWHATFNSRGKYFNAQNALELAEDLATSLADFTDVEGSATPVGLTGAQIVTGKSFAYQTKYEKGWWGNVNKYKLNDDGSVPVDANNRPINPLWNVCNPADNPNCVRGAAEQVEAQAAVVGMVKGWDVNRKIVTMNDSTAVPFRLNKLSTAQQNSLIKGWTDAGITPAPTQQQVLDFLRGDPSNEGLGNPKLRERVDQQGNHHVLGDFVLSAPVPVGPPSLPYDDAGNPGYTAFKTSKASRTPMVYVGGNDGMLHALLDSEDNTDPNRGKETWAYVPQVLFSGGDPNDTGHGLTAKFSLGALAFRSGGIPRFAHKSYVNWTPRIWDVDLKNTSGSAATDPDWRTLLVGGLGAGGRAVYALDVTVPVALTDSEDDIVNAKKVLWEFNNTNTSPKGDPNLGYVFDAPTLVKAGSYGWVALVASGYNNADGHGYLFVLNPRTGELLKKLSLPSDGGTALKPVGLGQIRAFVKSRKNPIVLQVYGGDLQGRVWRFDLSNANPALWPTTAVLFATLKDATAKAQPVTTGIRIEIDQSNNTDRYLFIGTGKMLDQPDLADNSVISTMYVIRDGTVDAPDMPPAGGYTRAALLPVDGTCTGTPASPCTGAPVTRGWYQDGEDASWKIITDPFADLSVAAFAFSFPAADPCDLLSATLFARSIAGGNSVLQDAGGVLQPSIAIDAGVAGVTLVQGVNVDGSMPVKALITTMTGEVYTYGIAIPGAAGTKHRVSWRLLNP
jgi:type IV pilus assembly protein PilY1